MKNKSIFIAFITIAALLIAVTVFLKVKNSVVSSPLASSIVVKQASSEISASGTIVSRNEATLHFQTGGKLTYLPVKEGDSVYQGQTIAQLDTYGMQRLLTIALNNYRSTRDSFDQTKDNISNNILQEQQKLTLETTDKHLSTGDTENNIVNDIVKRIADESQATLDNSVANVEIANYSMQLATLQSPITGTVVHEDVKLTNVNILPTTSFTVADLNNLIFKANVLEKDIDFISVGSEVKIKLNGMGEKAISGTVEKIYPQKVTLSDGSNVYQVDIQSPQLNDLGKYNQTGNVLIKSNLNKDVTLIPAWTVLSHQFVWVMSKNKPVLKQVVIGKVHGSEIEIVNGLTLTDRIIINPKEIPAKDYMIL